MNTMTFRQAAHEVSAAIRRPEQLALRYRHAEVRELRPLVLLLLANAFFGMAAYGAIIRTPLVEESTLSPLV